MVCYSFENIIQFLSLDVLGVFRVREKVFKLELQHTFQPKNVKTFVTEPL